MIIGGILLIAVSESVSYFFAKKMAAQAEDEPFEEYDENEESKL